MRKPKHAGEHSMFSNLFYFLRLLFAASPALVIGGSAMASELHVSAPIAMVVAGLIIGNLGRKLAMNDMTRRYLDGFWELLDDMLNALLFALIGVEGCCRIARSGPCGCHDTSLHL